MDDYTEVTAKLCNPVMNMDSDENGCSDVTLKYPKPEIIKLQASAVSDSKQLPDIDYSVAAQFWGLAFTSVVGLWLFAKGVGSVINMVRNI